MTDATAARPAEGSASSIAPLFRLDGKVAIVTGASKGIGEAIARALVEFGARVVVSSRKQAAVDEVALGIRDAGGEAVGVAAHVGDTAQVQHLLEETVARFGGVDVIVNNAASNPTFGPLDEQSQEVFDKIFAVNVKGPFELCRLAYPIMKARGGGSVINISSIGGLTPEPGLGLYSVSKAAMISLTKVMAAEWGVDNIRANAVCPGLIKTKFSQALWGNEQIVQQMMALQPIKRIGIPEDVAGLCLFLASDASAYCTGGVYTADGGYTI